MTLNNLRECIGFADEIAVIGREKMIDGVLCHIVGLIRKESSVKILALTYDEEYREIIENAEIAGICGIRKNETHRNIYRNDIRFTKKDVFANVYKIHFGEKEFSVTEKTGTLLENTEELIVLYDFMKNGWDPKTIGDYDTSNLYLDLIELSEETESLSEVDLENIEFIKRSGSEQFLIEKKVKLTVGGKGKKISFKDKKTGDSYTAYINDVSLFDIRAEILKNFDDPRFKERISPQELEKIKQDSMRSIDAMCPEGMRFISVEYECDDISLQFYLKSYLDSEPDYSGDGPTGIILRSDEKTGSHGMKMKYAVIQSPVVPDTSEVEAEIFSGFRTVKYENFTV